MGRSQDVGMRAIGQMFDHRDADGLAIKRKTSVHGQVRQMAPPKILVGSCCQPSQPILKNTGRIEGGNRACVALPFGDRIAKYFVIMDRYAFHVGESILSRLLKIGILLTNFLERLDRTVEFLAPAWLVDADTMNKE